MRAYRRIGGHSWSQPIMELLHKLGWGIPLIVEAYGGHEEGREVCDRKGERNRGRSTRHVAQRAGCVSWEEEIGTKIRAKIKWLICFSVQQCQHEVTSLLCNPLLLSASLFHSSTLLSSSSSPLPSLFLSHFSPFLPIRGILPLCPQAPFFAPRKKKGQVSQSGDATRETYRFLISAKCGAFACESCGKHCATLMSAFTEKKKVSPQHNCDLRRSHANWQLTRQWRD